MFCFIIIKLNSNLNELIFYTDTITVKEFRSVQEMHLKKLVLGNNICNKIAECIKNRIQYNNIGIHLMLSKLFCK